MGYGYNYSGCGCGCMPSYGFAPYSTPYPAYGGFSGGCGIGGGTGWFAIVLVVFLLLIICGCSRSC